MYNDWMNRVVRMKRECDGAVCECQFRYFMGPLRKTY